MLYSFTGEAGERSPPSIPRVCEITLGWSMCGNTTGIFLMKGKMHFYILKFLPLFSVLYDGKYVRSTL